jgi:hypothetical protein
MPYMLISLFKILRNVAGGFNLRFMAWFYSLSEIKSRLSSRNVYAFQFGKFCHFKQMKTVDVEESLAVFFIDV